MFFKKGTKNMKVLIDNDEIKITVSEEFTIPRKTLNNKSLADYMLENTLEKFKLYKKIFNVKKLDKITFTVYDEEKELELWRKEYINIYGINPPEYSRGFFEPESNFSCCCLHANSLYKSNWWNKAVCTLAHETFHIYYKKYIYKEERIVWFDEGIAQYLSGENDEWLNNDEMFLKKLKYFLDNYVPINNLNERIQGNNSVSDNLIFQREKVFNGYLASILIIKYIVETKEKKYLFNLMQDNKKIRAFGKYALTNMISYYKEKYKI